mmetsp:Transcript_105213/g.339368  ORF Transcript_105213/g.339368 Transcript_105213/m.339368 type:complete len:206 (-) Transcript_105213:1236-1853(-)
MPRTSSRAARGPIRHRSRGGGACSTPGGFRLRRPRPTPCAGCRPSLATAAGCPAAAARRARRPRGGRRSGSRWARPGCPRRRRRTRPGRGSTRSRQAGGRPHAQRRWCQTRPCRCRPTAASTTCSGALPRPQRRGPAWRAPGRRPRPRPGSRCCWRAPRPAWRAPRRPRSRRGPRRQPFHRVPAVRAAQGPARGPGAARRACRRR